MRFSSRLTNHLGFRLLWLLLCLPLEVLRVLLMPVALLVYLSTLNLTLCLWVALWIAVHLGIVVPARAVFGQPDDWFFIGGVAALWLCTQWSYALRQLARLVLAAWWRLPPRVPRPRDRKPREMRARIVVKSTADPRQTRQRMTQRLSPELRAMLGDGP
jgi:hypothetical protein